MRMTDLIYGSVSMSDVLKMYHHTGSRGRTNCPIHNGKDDNFCYTDKVYHCWTCGAKGNVVGFVMDLFGLTYMDACRKINEDFNLNIPLDGKPTFRQKQKARLKLEKMRAEYEAEEQRKQAENDRYNALMDEYARLDIIRIYLAPKTPDEPLNDLYVQAMHRLPVVEYKLDCEDWRCGRE